MAEKIHVSEEELKKINPEKYEKKFSEEDKKECSTNWRESSLSSPAALLCDETTELPDESQGGNLWGVGVSDFPD